MSDLLRQHFINDALSDLLVPIDGLVLDPRNARRHPQRNLDAIKASLAEFGQQKPIVITEDGTIVAGNGTVAAARALGWTHIAAVRSNLKDPIRLRAFAVADNRTSELAEWDEAELVRALDEIRAAGVNVEEVLAFQQAEIDKLIEGLPGAEAPPPGEFREVDEDLSTDYCCPSCGYSWSGQPK